MRGVAVVFVLAVTAGGATLAGAPGDDEAALEAGQRLYVSDCASCHGFDGRGRPGQGPSITSAGAAGAHFYLSTGRMPMATVDDQSRRKPVKYDEEEIAALVAYVASLGDGPPIPDLDFDDVDLAAGNTLYRENCAACHNSAGSGGALGEQTFAPSLFSATALQTAEAARVGPGAMPEFSEGTLSDEELEDLVAYVQYLHDPDDRGGAPLGRVGPIPEGFVAWSLGLGGMLLVARWIGSRERRA
jgi:ubiquinol-cytochrome c reductase cytochrome c subunit